jgi:pimeloyl-ACP methyl ester carboxylesterase
MHLRSESWMNRLFLAALFATLLALPLLPGRAAEMREPYGIGLEGYPYPYPVNMLPLVNDGEELRMAYMDVAPAQGNGRVVVLLHGRNFPASYWAAVIKTLTEAGYRTIVPDQIGFGKSSKPAGELHFDTLARNTMALLDHLGIARADIVAHSLGGMLAVRIARAYPDRINHLVLAAPIGLEDYRMYVPPIPTERSSRTRTSSPPKATASSSKPIIRRKSRRTRSRRSSMRASTSRARPTINAGCAPLSVRRK